MKPTRTVTTLGITRPALYTQRGRYIVASRQNDADLALAYLAWARLMVSKGRPEEAAAQVAQARMVNHRSLRPVDRLEY